jgi:isoquinoline 1-oxidoreductase beta subunit
VSVPNTVRLKDTSDFRVIGKSIPRLDTPAKVDGSAVFGMDVRIQNQLTATVTHCPVFGGKSGTIRSEQALRVKGVRRVVPLDTGVAVVADDLWSAHLGQQALAIEWVLAPHPANTTAVLRSQLHEAASESGTRVCTSGDTAAAL